MCRSHLLICCVCVCQRVKDRERECLYVCSCYRPDLWHAILQCQGFCRVSAISHTSWKMSDPGTKHTAVHITKGRGGGCLAARTVTSEDDSEMANLLDTCHHAESFSSIFPHTPIAKLWTGCMFTHVTRSEKKHQTGRWVLVGSDFLPLPFVVLTWEGTMEMLR